MRNELKVGITVFISLVSLFIAIFFIKDIQFGKTGQKYIATFSFLNNLLSGGHVKLHGGIRVGTVNKLTFSDGKANVHFTITNKTVNAMLKENQGVNFLIRGASLLGEKYLLIQFDAKDGEKFKLKIDKNKKIVGVPKIKGIEAADLENVLGEFKGLSKKIDRILSNQLTDVLNLVKFHLQNKKITEIINNLANASGNLNTLMKNSNQLVLDLQNKHLNKTFQNMNSTLKNANTTILSTNSEIQAISRHIRTLLSTTNTGVDRLFNNKDTGVHALTKEGKTLLVNLNKTVAQVQRILKNLEDEDTPIGALVKDKAMAEDLKKTIRQLNDITKTLKDSPLISDDSEYHPGPF